MKCRGLFILFALSALCWLPGSLSAQAVVITEFLAENRDGLADEDGDSSDWIEIQNQGAATVNLDGWSLTDDAGDLRKWFFPAIELLPGEYLLVFASGKDRAAAGSELHASFRLDKAGEFLGLVAPGGLDAVHAYAPQYPPQRPGISYGFSQMAAQVDFVSSGSAARFMVPADDRFGVQWRDAGFDDSGWMQAETGVGFATGDAPPPPVRIENVALGGRATQSSEGWGGEPMRGIDGNTDGDWTAGTTFHTNGSNSWWEVDLLGDYTVDSIKLWNRMDCCRERFTDFTVELLDSDRSVVFETGPHNGNSEETFFFPDIEGAGRFVRISMPGPYLHLAEVEVFGEVFDEDLIFQRQVRTDVAGEMQGRNATAYLRVPFEVEDPGLLDTLTLRLKYDDGFVAWLNGTEVANSNAPQALRWDSVATRENPVEQVLIFEGFNVSSFRDALSPGANVLAIQGLNLSPGDDDFLLLPELAGFHFSQQVESYMTEPSPGESNADSQIVGFVADTSFSLDRGFYDQPFDVEISTETADAEIRYTVDGSIPTPTNGSVYAGPVRISTTTILRAAAFKEGLGPTNTDTHTYIFLDDVFDSSVMRTSVTRDRVNGPRLRDGLADLPSLCITAATTVFPSEEPISLELIHPDGTPGFQEDAGAKYFGLRWGGSTYLKKSLRISFRSEYGDSKLRYPLFEGYARGVPPVEVFDQIELRTGHHDADMRGFYMSDRFTSNTMLDLGHLNPHGRYVHVYLNGVYWGQYNMRERFSADMFAEYFGGEEADYEAIKANGGPWNWDAVGTPFNGDGSTWSWIRARQANFVEIQRHLNVTQYIDYMLMVMFGNTELEFRCVGERQGNEWLEEGRQNVGFQFFMNDTDGFLRGPTDGGGGRPGFNGNPVTMSQPGRQAGDGPGSIFSMLLAENHPDYRVLLADRIHKMFFNDGAMSAEKNMERLRQQTEEIERSILAESARWNYRTPASWESAKDRYLNGVLPSRTDVMVRHYREAGLMLPVPAPAFVIDGRAQHGGAISPGAELEIGVVGIERIVDLPVIETGAPRSVLVPRDGNLGDGWLLPDYVEGEHGETWQAATGGVGYDRNDDYQDVIDLDVREEMENDPGNTSIFIRIPFNIASQQSIASMDNLTLVLDYDDGFVAYLNGARVAEANAPGADELEWDSLADGSNEADPGNPAVFELQNFRENLRVGMNILAIHGLNFSANSSDFLIRAGLVQRTIEVGLVDDSAFYTLDGSDPRLPGGDLSPTAISYTGPFRLLETTLVSSRIRTLGGSWGPLADTVFYTDMPLRVTEIMYNPAPPAEGSPFQRRELEYIELQNVSTETLDLRGVRFVEGVQFDFTDSAVTELGPGEVVVLVEDLQGFASRYDLARILVAGEYSGALSDGGERLSVRGPLDEPVLDFEYDDLWHPETDGEGASLVVIDALDDLSTWGDAAAWRPSELALGSPGIDESGIEPRGRQLPGDANQDARVDISDAVALLLHLFGRRPELPPCEDGDPGSPGNIAVLDSNGDDEVDVSDAVWLLAYMYQGGPPPSRGTDCVRLEGCPNLCGF